MKIFEYQNPDLMQRVNDKMRAAGLQYINYGSRASVFKNRSGEIVKIFENDPCYKAFVALAHKNKDNPHFPKVRKIAEFKTPELKGAYLVKIEPLERISFSEFYNNVGFHSHLFIEYSMTGMDLGVGSEGHILQKRFGNRNPRYDEQAYKQAEDASLVWQRKNQLFVKAINLVIRNVGKCKLDFHDENFMKRGDTWVITDPTIIPTIHHR